MRNSLNGLIILCLSSFALTILSSQDTIFTNYPGSDQRWEKVFNNGQKMAENIYYQDSSPWMTVSYSPKSEEGWKWYYENGNPYFEATIVNDQLQGKYKIWYENGQLAEKLIFIDNIEHGIAEFYHPNGQLAMKGEFNQGKMEGEWEFYDENGNPPTGMWEWKFAASFENTRLKGLLIYGKPSGIWKNWGTANLGLPDQLQFEKNYSFNF